jgi:hypothetical protein
VVLVRYGRSKEGHNAIAQHLIHGAFVAVHGLHHQMQGRVEEAPGRFWVKTGNQLRRACEIGKQHRDLLALAFQISAVSENLFREMWWGVSQRPMCSLALRWQGRTLGRVCRASPDQHFTVLIDGESFRVDDFSLQIVEVRVIEIESALEGTVRQPLLTLQ